MCNSLLKKKYVTSFYTVNRKIKIIYKVNNSSATALDNYEVDLIEALGKDILDEVNVCIRESKISVYLMSSSNVEKNRWYKMC